MGEPVKPQPDAATSAAAKVASEAVRIADRMAEAAQKNELVGFFVVEQLADGNIRCEGSSLDLVRRLGLLTVTKRLMDRMIEQSTNEMCP